MSAFMHARVRLRRQPNLVRHAGTVPNTGSEARDHLANERTFLAWARTGMSFVGLGVAVDQVRRLDSPPYQRTAAEELQVRAPGLVCVGTGGVFLSYATWRYFAVQRALMRGEFLVNKGGILAVVGVSSVMTMVGLGVLFLPDGTGIAPGPERQQGVEPTPQARCE